MGHHLSPNVLFCFVSEVPDTILSEAALQNVVPEGMSQPQPGCIFLCLVSTPSSRDRPSSTANPKKHRNGLRFLPACLPPRGFYSGFHAGLVSTNVSQMMGGREDEKSEMFHCGR